MNKKFIHTIALDQNFRHLLSHASDISSQHLEFSKFLLRFNYRFAYIQCVLSLITLEMDWIGSIAKQHLLQMDAFKQQRKLLTAFTFSILLLEFNFETLNVYSVCLQAGNIHHSTNWHLTIVAMNTFRINNKWFLLCSQIKNNPNFTASTEIYCSNSFVINEWFRLQSTFMVLNYRLVLRIALI